VSRPEPGPASEDVPKDTINRNWTELLQELRSTQTGVQVLIGFLLAVPFTDRFHTLDRVERTAYLVVLTSAVGAAMALLAPIAYHRILFRRDRRPWLVERANRIARAGLVLAAVTMCGVVFLAFGLVAGRAVGAAASLVALLGYVALWLVVPLRAHPPARR
jgi:hypothetical protein